MHDESTELDVMRCELILVTESKVSIFIPRETLEVQHLNFMQHFLLPCFFRASY